MFYDYQKRKWVIQVRWVLKKKCRSWSHHFFQYLKLNIVGKYIFALWLILYTGQPESWKVPWKPGSFCLGRYDQKQNVAVDFDESTTHLHASDNVLSDSHPSKWPDSSLVSYNESYDLDHIKSKLLISYWPYSCQQPGSWRRCLWRNAPGCEILGSQTTPG